ncbi:MAG: hypothetical protein C4K48_00205 [Candidatus Thorarchaeota archaeon]|nr:MAG: hypothetical protein C4K48_00205 [Candidatus Thorarchaeota archaeon]
MQTTSDAYLIGIILAVVATIFFSVTNVIYKRMSDDISVMDIMVSRMWVSLPVSYSFAVIAAGSYRIVIPLEAMFPLAFSMIIGIVIGDAMYFLSQERIGVTRAFPISMSYPLMVYALTAYFLGEPVIPQRVVGAFIVVAGVGLVARTAKKENSEESPRWDRQDMRIGLVLAFLTLVAWALSDSIFQFGLIGVGAAEANFFRTLFASVALVPFFILSLRNNRALPRKRTIAYATLTGLVGMSFAILAGSYAVKFLGATVASIIIASGPALTLPLSVVFLGEAANRSVLVGTLLTIIGIILVTVVI